MLRWCVCDNLRYEGDPVCLYAEASLRKMKSDRCIKHGAILDYAPSLNGMTREQIKRKWKAEDARRNVA
jgi:hypothetical protein